MNDECPHGGDPHTCPPCQRAAGRITEAHERLVSPAWTAQFGGVWNCPGCDLPIHRGQVIVRVTYQGHADRGGTYYHAGCQ